MSKPFLGFWGELSRPIVGLAPMDGVTDVVCRGLAADYGRPDVIFTEFTHAQGLLMAPKRLLNDFEYNEIERPVVAQIYGHRPEDFYLATHVVCELGFDGVDINMGCPARKVVSRQCGAGLIEVPDRAREIIQAVRRAIADWVEGQTLQQLGLRRKLIDGVARMNEQRIGRASIAERRRIPYSVKTRLGYDSVIIESWLETLLQEAPAVISIHGRTLKQMYRGEADWEAITRAVSVATGSGTLVLGNGDLNDLRTAAERILSSGVDGVLLGRSTIGNPWIFQGKAQLKQAVADGTPAELTTTDIGWRERFAMAIEHANRLETLRGIQVYKGIRKHLVGYLRGFYGASELRVRAMQASSATELEQLLAAEQGVRAGQDTH